MGPRAGVLWARCPRRLHRVPHGQQTMQAHVVMAAAQGAT